MPAVSKEVVCFWLWGWGRMIRTRRDRRLAFLLLGAAPLALAVPMVAGAQSSTETYTYDALGRLVVAKTTGGSNNDETHSLCFDKSGNRTDYVASSDGFAAGCVDAGSGTSSPTPSPSPSPTPTPGNTPPKTVSDETSGACDTIKTVNLTANDTDAEGHYPLALVSISRVSGAQASASVVSASAVSVDFGPLAGTTNFSYQVQDSQGATSTGTLTSSTSGGSCEL